MEGCQGRGSGPGAVEARRGADFILHRRAAQLACTEHRVGLGGLVR
jgi:hypothetical protein